MSSIKQPLRVGIGGPVGSGKTALMEQLCKRLSGELEIAGPFALNLNVASILSPFFERFDGALPAQDSVLVVSGRTSFEIVAKAWAAGISAIVVHTSTDSPTVSLRNSGGPTPTIVNTFPSTSICLPTTSGDAPNERLHHRSLITATCCSSSSSRNARPTAGRT